MAGRPAVPVSRRTGTGDGARRGDHGHAARAAYKTIWDTFGIVRGTTYPDELVIIGGHRDAWGPGTADNVRWFDRDPPGGARRCGRGAKAGHRPKRTIVFATWDAEEWGLIGSTEYVEDDSLRIARGAVMYINLDVAAAGPNFGATGSPSLRETLRSVLREVPSPAPIRAPCTTVGGAGRDSTGPTFGDPGGGSDFAGFYNHLGVPDHGLGLRRADRWCITQRTTTTCG